MLYFNEKIGVFRTGFPPPPGRKTVGLPARDREGLYDMKEYHIPICSSCPDDWSGISGVPVDDYPWGGEFRPETTAQLVFVPGDGFWLHMVCGESDPRATFTQFYDMVCLDSCVEFFACFDANTDDYINFEVNPLGTSHVSHGPNRGKRTRIDAIIGHPFPVTASVEPERWSVVAHFPIADLVTCFGIDPSVFREGYAFPGNFYTCGGNREHFGVWNRVGTESPDFHRPEYFGKLIIG